MKSYTSHYVFQRITAAILLFIIPWFLYTLLETRHMGYAEIVNTFGSPWSVALVFLMLVSGFFHGFLGIQTICLDYLPNVKIRSAVIFGVGILFIFLTAFSTFSLVRLMAGAVA
jgi:succinate dehydrogenase / fumarate reductase membrane anchor subunit